MSMHVSNNLKNKNLGTLIRLKGLTFDFEYRYDRVKRSIFEREFYY